jgi:hypothetical protein
MTEGIRVLAVEINIHDDLSCNICLDVVPCASQFRQCSSCQKCFCYNCIIRLPLDASFSCPICKAKSGFSKNKIVCEQLYPQITTKCENTKCFEYIIPNVGHENECLQRKMSCPVCSKNIPVANVHKHMQKCVRIEVNSFEFEMYMRRCTKDSAFRFFTVLNCEHQSNVRHNNLCILYVWRDGENIKMICVQLSNCGTHVCAKFKFSNSENSYEKMYTSVNVHGNDSDFSAKTFPCVMQYNQFELVFNVRELKLNSTYKINIEDDGWCNAKLLDIIYAPMRGIFITTDARKKKVEINLDDSHFEKYIKLHTCNSVGVNGMSFANIIEAMVIPQRRHGENDNMPTLVGD